MPLALALSAIQVTFDSIFGSLASCDRHRRNASMFRTWQHNAVRGEMKTTQRKHYMNLAEASISAKV